MMNLYPYPSQPPVKTPPPSIRRISIFMVVFFTALVRYTSVHSQSCTTKEYVYINEPNGIVHKMRVNPAGGGLTEVGGVNGIPWLKNPTEFPFPHGLGVDRNGFLYIGSNFTNPNDIRKVDCRGGVFPETEYRIPPLPTSNNWGELLTNIQSYAGFIYANGPDARIYKIDPCTGTTIGYIQFPGNTNDWGLYIDKNGKFYVTQPTGQIYAFKASASDFTAHTTFQPLIDLNANPSIGGLSPAYAKLGLQGITTDNAGNIYVVEGNRDARGTPSRLLKFSPTGAFIAAGPIDSDGTDKKGWNQMTGVIYSASSNKLYTTSLNPDEDCIYRWNTNLTPDGEAVGPVPNAFGQCKAIGILAESCPVSETIDRSVCGVKVGDRISLSELLKCEGIVCEGQWAPVMGNSNLTFNECDLTVTVNALPACGSFKISNEGLAGSSCEPFTIELNVTYLAEVKAQVIAGNQTVCPQDDPKAFTVTTPASTAQTGSTITYQWQRSTTSASAGFANIAGATSATYDSDPVTQTTYFRVLATIKGCTDGTCSDTSNVATLTLGTNCPKPCTPPARLVTATDPTCTSVGKLTLTSSNGDKYGISSGTTYTGPAYAAATAVPGTLPAIIKNNLSSTADSAYTIRVFNKDADCFKDTTVTVKATPIKPTVAIQAGFPACRNDFTTYTIKFTATGGTVTTVPSLTVTGDSISVPIATASVKLIITSAGGCKDSVTVAAPVCDKPVGSLGDFVWKDLNDNGKQDSGEPGVKDVKVILYAATTTGQPGAKLDSTTTSAAGKYNFANLSKGDYLVQIVLSTIPDTCRISDKQNQAGVPDSLDNDFNNGGFSDVVKLDPAKGGLDKDNPTIDAALVKTFVCIKPDAGKDSTYACVNNQLPTSFNLNDAQVGQKWKILSPVPAGANITVTTPEGLVTGTITAGTYNFILQTQSDSVNCRDTVKIVVQPCVVDCVKPDAGPDSTLVCTGTTQPTSIDLKDAKAGEKWKILTFPTPTTGNFGVSISTPAGLVTPKSPATSLIPGTYQFVLQNQSDSLKCRDTISVVVPDCTPAPCVKPLIGTITTTPATCANGTPNNNAAFTVGGISGGDKFSTATTLAGLAPYASATTLTGGTISLTGLPNPASPSGQTYFVRIYNGKTDCFRDTTLTLTFNDCGSGPCFDIATSGDGMDTLCSGYYGEVTSVKVGNNLPVKFVRFNSPQTVATVYTGGTLLETVTPSDSIASWPNGIPGSQFPANTGTSPVNYYVYAISADTTGLPANCRPFGQKVYTVLPLPKFTVSTEPICADSTTYTTKVNLPAGTFTLTVARGLQTIGNGPVPQDIIETRSGVSGSTTFTLAVADSAAAVVIRDEATGCATSGGVAKPVFVDCNGTYDLALDKSIDKKLAMLGETVNYTIRVWNEGQGNATGVEVTDSLNAGVQYVTHATATGNYNPTTKIWTIGNLAVGDTVTLSIAVKVVAQGVWFNTAEITGMNEKDEDSTPGNGKDGEDDIDRECFTVPVMVCRGQGTSIVLNVPAQYTGVVWFRKTQGGQPVKVAEGNSFTATETELGTYEYTFTSTSGTCPAEGCCPTIIVVEDCCPVDVCVPFVIKKKVK